MCDGKHYLDQDLKKENNHCNNGHNNLDDQSNCSDKNEKEPLNIGIIKKNLQLPLNIKNYQLEIYQSIASTNDYLKNLPINYRTLNICLAEQQTQGKGQFNRLWFSPFATNIYLSLSWLTKHNCLTLSPLSLAISLAIIKILEELGISSKELKCKWPNDIFWCSQKNQDLNQDKKKLAGILIEISENHLHKGYKVVIGVGLNINMTNIEQSQPCSTTQMITQPWTSLCQILDSKQNRSQIAAKLINAISNVLDELEQSGKNKILATWPDYDMLLEQEVTLCLCNNGQTIKGIAKGINDLGYLKLAIPNKQNKFKFGEKIICYTSGEVEIQKT